MIDRILVKQRLSMIAEYCTELKLLQQLPKEIFLEKRNSAAAESFLRRSLERFLILAVISSLKPDIWSLPKSIKA